MLKINNVCFTLFSPCSLRCLKYCPQDILAAKYKGEHSMLHKVFMQCLVNLPENTDLHFGGFGEPSLNHSFPDFVMIARELVKKITVYSTLSGLTLNSMKEMALHIDELIIHVPDGEVLKMPVNPDYEAVFFYAVTNIKNVGFSIMNKRFMTNNRENIARGKPGKRRFGKCIQGIQPIIMPNGEAYLCCMDFCLTHKVGNLALEPYSLIVERIKAGGWSLCSTCTLKEPFGYTAARKLFRKFMRID